MDFLKDHAGWLFAGSLFMFVATLVAMPWLIVRMAPDYFVRKEPPDSGWRREHPVGRLAILAVKNLVGLLLVLAGVVLSVPLVPGQGLLTILIGITLLDFPGKRRLERWLVRRRQIRKTVDWIRAKAGRPPVILP